MIFKDLANKFSGFVLFLIFGVMLVGGAHQTNAQAISEGFDSFAALAAAGWSTDNNSQPAGTGVWTQCGGTAIPPAQAGANLATSCTLVNFTSGNGVATISNWLIGPNRTFRNGDVISFYTRTANNNFPDRLQLRLSTNGASVNVGTLATDVGDFTTLLQDIDPIYAGTYPTTWTQFTSTLSGLPAGGVSGRFAFRYFVENGGPDGANSNIIGVDTLVYTPFATAASVSISGRVMDADGRGITNARVILADSRGVSRVAITSRRGTYSFEDVDSGQTCTISVASRRYSFAPRIVELVDNLSDLDFTPDQ